MRRSIMILVSAAASLALAGCVQAQKPLASDYGVAVRRNIAAQIADPDARYARRELPAADGSRAALAQERYVSGDVAAPAAQGTTTIGGGGSSAGASGGK